MSIEAGMNRLGAENIYVIVPNREMSVLASRIRSEGTTPTLVEVRNLPYGEYADALFMGTLLQAATITNTLDNLKIAADKRLFRKESYHRVRHTVTRLLQNDPVCILAAEYFQNSEHFKEQGIELPEILIPQKGKGEHVERKQFTRVEEQETPHLDRILQILAGVYGHTPMPLSTIATLAYPEPFQWQDSLSKTEAELMLDIPRALKDFILTTLFTLFHP